MKKIIALIIAVTFIITALNISAYATSEPSAMTVQEFYAAQSDTVDRWVNGDITYNEWYEQQNAILDEFYSTNQSVGDSAYATALAIGERFRGVSQKISNAVEQWGDGARERVSDWWNSVCNSNNVPIEATQTSNTDMKGYSSKYINHGANNAYTVYYIDGYILIDDNGTSVQVSYRNSDTNKPNVMVEFYQYDKNTNSHYLSSGYPRYTTSGGSGSYAGNILYEDIAKGIKEFYGDVRYGDGSQFPTNDEWEYGSIKKFDELPERDLEDLLNDFAEEMERQNPDLSSIEGLLRAIYARMGTLDSDNDNDLLNAINANILALLEADNKKDEIEKDPEDDTEYETNEELVKILLEIRDILKDGTISIDYTEFLEAIDDFKKIVNDNNSELLNAIDDLKNIADNFNYDELLKSIEDFYNLSVDNNNSLLKAIENMQNEISDNSEELLKVIEDNNNSLLNSLNEMQNKIDKNNNSLLSSFKNLQNVISKNYSSILDYIKKFKSSFDDFDKELLNAIKDLKDSIGSAASLHGHEISGTLYNVKPLDKNWFNSLFHGDENLKVEYEGNTYYLEDCGCLKLNGKYYQVNMNYDTVDLIDLDFSSDDFEIFVKFSDDKDYSEIRDSLGTLRDILPQNEKARGGISTFSLNEEKGFFEEIFSRSQQRKINTVMGYVEDFLALGVPYESIQENLSVYETIIFDNGHTPQDLTFTIFGKECTLLSYQSLTSTDDVWENTSEYTSSLDIVKAFTSILISFWWVLSMYKKLSNLI